MLPCKASPRHCLDVDCFFSVLSCSWRGKDTTEAKEQWWEVIKYIYSSTGNPLHLADIGFPSSLFCFKQTMYLYAECLKNPTIFSLYFPPFWDPTTQYEAQYYSGDSHLGYDHEAVEVSEHQLRKQSGVVCSHKTQKSWEHLCTSGYLFLKSMDFLNGFSVRCLK